MLFSAYLLPHLAWSFLITHTCMPTLDLVDIRFNMESNFHVVLFSQTEKDLRMCRNLNHPKRFHVYLHLEVAKHGNNK